MDKKTFDKLELDLGAVFGKAAAPPSKDELLNALGHAIDGMERTAQAEAPMGHLLAEKATAEEEDTGPRTRRGGFARTADLPASSPGKKPVVSQPKV